MVWTQVCILVDLETRNIVVRKPTAAFAMCRVPLPVDLGVANEHCGVDHGAMQHRARYHWST